MKFTEFYAGDDDNQRRFDKIVRRLMPDMSLSALYRALRTGDVRLNGKKAEPGEKVFAGDRISADDALFSKQQGMPHMKRDAPLSYGGSEIFDVLFRNDYVLAINKPYGKSVHGANSLAERIVSEWKLHRDAAKSLSFVIGPLHRLDKNTTGVLLFSQNLQGARWMSEAFSRHIIGKKYVAIVQGNILHRETWKDCIKKSDVRGGFHTVAVSHNAGKLSCTSVIPLCHGIYKGKDVSLVEFSISTGRTHQIRAQSSYHGFPLFGDTAYGAEAVEEAQSLYLHAYQMDFPANNPLNMPPKICADIPPNFKRLLCSMLIKWDSSLII